MTRATTLLRSHGLDLLVVLVAAQGALEVALRSGTANGPETPAWFAAPAAALTVLPLVARRRHPFAAPASTWLLGTVVSLVDSRLIPALASVTVAGLVAAFLLGHLTDPARARVGLVVVLGGAAAIESQDPVRTPGSMVFLPVLFATGWLAGYVVQRRGEQVQAAELRAAYAEREREAAARVAVAEERARIARELHDIVAHAVSVMVLHAGAARHQLDAASPAAEDALRSVEQTGRVALADMRRLLEAMRRDDDDLALAPQPGLASLPALAEEVGRTGLPVRLAVEGAPRSLPHALDVSAYRIVQEGLTNALKHARATRADVTVRYADDGLLLEVRDDGRSSPPDAGVGHGLVGVRERAKVFGGEASFTTGSRGGHRLRARLSLAEQRS